MALAQPQLFLGQGVAGRPLGQILLPLLLRRQPGFCRSASPSNSLANANGRRMASDAQAAEAGLNSSPVSGLTPFGQRPEQRAGIHCSPPYREDAPVVAPCSGIFFASLAKTTLYAMKKRQLRARFGSLHASDE